jgi:hypothetical protein
MQSHAYKVLMYVNARNVPQDWHDSQKFRGRLPRRAWTL